MAFQRYPVVFNDFTHVFSILRISSYQKRGRVCVSFDKIYLSAIRNIAYILCKFYNRRGKLFVSFLEYLFMRIFFKASRFNAQDMQGQKASHQYYANNGFKPFFAFAMQIAKTLPN